MPTKTRVPRPQPVSVRVAPDRWTLSLLPVVAVLVYLAYAARGFHWDTLERAYLLEHAGSYLRTWDGTPRSQFFAFAHVLELPLAWLVGRALPGASGLRTLVVLEAVMAGLTLWVLGRLVRFWGGNRTACLVAQTTFAVSLAFWKMGSSGEEKIVALATQLLFLWTFWRALRGGRGAAWAGVMLAVAVLTHLTGAVLVPFALAALAFLPPAWRHSRAAVLRAVAFGILGGGILYYAVAAATTGVRSPSAFFEYATFFHRGAGNFFEMTGAAASGSRLERVASGLGGFLAGDAWLRIACGILFLCGLAFGAGRIRHDPRRTLCVHAALLVIPWTLHFAFFEPQNHESWTLVAALWVLVLAAGLPSGRRARLAFVLPAVLFGANLRHYVAHHRPMEYEAFWHLARRQTGPEDILVATGGLQNNRALRGGLAMRFFLAHERQRTVVSLYDVLGVTQPEFWPRPFESPSQLQAALDAGRRAYVPGFLRSELDTAVQSGLFAIDYAPVAGDSLFEIKRIGSLPR